MNGNSELLRPILVTGMGRAGSTLVMSLLGGDSRCVFDQIYPLESRYLSRIASFTAEWAGTTFERTESGRSVTAPRLGKHPVLLRQGQDQEKLVRIPEPSEMFLALWRTFSSSVRADRPQAGFYAEKVSEWLPAFLAPVLETYSLYLFRDPRDMFLSANAMNSQRGYLAFGRQAADSDTDYALTLAFKYLHRYESYKVFRNSGGACSLIRYEDVALDHERALSGLVEATGLQPRLPPDSDPYAGHRTTASVQESIGRWKRQSLSAEVIQVLEEVLFEPLDKLGYEVSRSESSLGVLAVDLTNAKSDNALVKSIQHVEPSGIGSGVEIKASDRSFDLALDIPAVRASNFREAWLCLSGIYGTECELSWSGREDDFDTERTVVKRYDPRPNCTTLRIPVAGHDLWQGTVSRLRIRLSHSSGEPKFSDDVTIRWLKLIPEVSAAAPPVKQPAAKRSAIKLFQKLVGTE